MPYLTLDEIPSGRICRPLFIPDDTGWLALFGGALTELTKAYKYQQFGTLTPQEMADACTEIVAQWYDDICGSCELPDGDPIFTVDEDFRLRQLIDGEWQDPTGDYYIPPPDARTEPTSAERICLAAANAEQALHDVYEEITDQFGTGLAILEVIADVAIFISTRVFAGAGLLWSALGRIALAAFRIGFEAVEFVTADFWNGDFSDNLRCTLIRAATDTAGVITFDFGKVNEELINQIEWLDPTLGSYAIAGQVRWMLNQLTPEVLNLMGGLTDITEYDCSYCDGPFCVLQDFNVDNYEWTVNSDAGFGALGVYEPPFTERVGYRTAEGDYGTFIVFQRYFNIDARFTRIEFDYDLSPGIFTAGAYSGVQITAAGVTIFDEVVSGAGTIVLEPLSTFTGFLLFNCLLSYSNSGSPSTGSGSVSAVRFYGVGDAGIETLLGVMCDVP